MKRLKWGAGALGVWLAVMLVIGAVARANDSLGLYPSVFYLVVLLGVLAVSYFAKQRIVLFLFMLHGGALIGLAAMNFLGMANTGGTKVWTGLLIAPLAGLYQLCLHLSDHLATEMFWAGCAMGGALMVLMAIAAFVPVCTRIGKEKDALRESERAQKQEALEQQVAERTEAARQLAGVSADAPQAESGFPSLHAQGGEKLPVPEEVGENGFPQVRVPRK